MRIFKKAGTKERLFEMFENVNQIKLNESNEINELDIPHDAVKAGARIPVKDISPETFPIGQHLPSYDTADAQQQMNSTGAIMRWKANFVKRFGEEGEAVKSEAWWWDIEGNPKFTEWKERGIATKAAAIDADRAKGYKFHDNYDPKINESGDVNQEIDDELDMRYSHSTKTIPHDEINDVAEMYGVDFEVAAQIAADVIARNQSQGYEEITDDVKELVKRMHDTDVDPNKYSVKSIWQVFEKEYEAGSEFNEFKEIWDKLTKDPNQMKMFESGDNPQLGSIKFNYDQKGNWIPEGYEDKKVALRSLEQPLGSGNWKVAVVSLDDMGELLDIVSVKNDWNEAKDALHSSIT